ncbi:MAG: transglycosylase domain-containing protein [Saprospiraceae bacterium]|nr:transglycosylase domain-containing protein [Saprospiraceae bacterium]
MTIKSKNSKSSYYINWLWIIGISSMLLILLLFVIVKFSRLPDISEMDNPKYEFSTIIYDINTKEIGKHFKYNRVWTTFEELNPHVVNALVATEDIRFFGHSGIDARSTVRALFYMGKKRRGFNNYPTVGKTFFY